MPYFYPVVNDAFDTTLKTSMTLWGNVARLEELAAGKSASNIGNLNKGNN